MLEPNPALRMKMAEIVSHPWITMVRLCNCHITCCSLVPQDVTDRIRQIIQDPEWVASAHQEVIY